MTRPAARGRGVFAACARTLIAWANADAPRRAVIAADPGDEPILRYRRMGFEEVSSMDALVVPLERSGTATSATPPQSHREQCRNSI
ncbi:MAG: hypothetical protein NVS3B7_08810 [Candidatus Elarobacter sp.]